jgi:hypothetical protein
MSDPATSSVITTALTGATLFGAVTQTDYGIIFGAFAGAVYYVATASDVPLFKRGCYFLTSFMVGVLGAGMLGDRLANLTGYNKQTLAPLAAVIVSALAIKWLAWLNEQSPGNWFSKMKGGGNG